MKKIKFLFLIFILLTPCLILWGCGVQLESLRFPQINKTILVDEIFELSVIPQPEVNNLNITYTVLDDSIATILSDGKTVKGVGEGQTKIYATANGISTEMTLTVTRARSQLSTPTGLNFSNETLYWTEVPNAKTYTVLMTKDNQTKSYQTGTNSLNFQAYDISYNEYTNYQFSVIAKPEINSIYFLDSNSSAIYNFKQIFSVSNLTYANNKISFNYNINSVDVNETGSIYFVLQVMKGSEYIVNSRISSSYLENNKISYLFAPTIVGDYSVKIFVDSEKISDSNTKQINIVKLSSPTISLNEQKVSVVGNNNDLFKYFKVENGVDVEISYDDLTLSNLESGEKEIFKAYAYRQNTQTSFYINSPLATLTIEKLITPSNLKIEKIIDSNSSINMFWNADYDIEDYEIYINNKLITISQYVEEEGQYIATLGGFEDSNTYLIYIVARKENTDNKIHIASEKSAEMTVVKLAKPEVSYNELSNSFNFIFPEINLGSILNFVATYEEVDYRLINEEINTLEKNINLASLEIQSGICSSVSTITRESSDSIIYLSSGEYSFNVKKLEAPVLSQSFVDNKLKISWNSVEDAQMYLVQIKDLTNNNIITYPNTSINESNGVVSIQINGLENGKDYSIYIQALTTLGTEIQFLGSEISTLTVHVLDAPILSVLDKGINTITYAWASVDQADSYDIYLDGRKVTNTTNLYYTVPPLGLGMQHSMSVVAISQEEGILPCQIENNINNKEFYILRSPTNITYEKNANNSIISFDQVNYATAYYLSITDTQNVTHEFNTFSLKDGKVYFTVETESVFNLEGNYHIYAYATSEEDNIVSNNRYNKTLKMLKAVTSINIDSDNLYIIWSTLDAQASSYEIYIDSVLMTDFEFLDEQGNKQARYYIGNLASGNYNIRIVAKGDNISFINSLPFTAQISKKENIEIPTISSFTITEMDSIFRLVFKEVENASYYKIYIVLENGTIIQTIQVESENANSIAKTINREFFSSGEIQYLYVRAFTSSSSQIYSNSDIPSFDDLTRVIKISKLNEPDELQVQDESLNLYGHQGIINEENIVNSLYSISQLSSGEVLNFIARKIDNVVDNYFNNVFYMASNWIPFSLNKLENPTINLSEETIVWSNINLDNIVNYKIIIDFYGLGETILKSIGRDVIFTMSTSDLNLTLQEIKSLCLQGMDDKLINYVGKYKIYISAEAVEQYEQKIYISSNFSELEFIITDVLTNDLITEEIFSEEEIQLKIDKKDSSFISEIELRITQEQNVAILKLKLDGTFEIVENSLSSFISNFYNISEDENNIYLKVYIQNVVADQSFTISWKGIGKEGYTEDAIEYDSLSCTKLTTPIFSYANNENGNYILIDENVLSTYDENVSIYAEYGNQKLTFANGILLIPSSWTNVPNIYVYATKNGVIRSDKIQVDIVLYSAVTNVRLENDETASSETFDNTFLKWDNVSSESSWVVYIYYNSILQSVNFTISCQLKLTSDLLENPGQYTFKIIAYGNNVNYFNSPSVEFTATKLPPEIVTITNTNGVLNWNLTQGYENYISSFRIKIDNSKETFAKNISFDSLQGYSGILPIQIRLVGNVNNKIISSDYSSAINFYKYTSPETFTINAGQFYFGSETNATQDLYRIKIGTEIYSYQEQEGFNPISYFNLSNTTSGTAYGFVAGGKTKTIGETNVLTLNSDVQEITFNRLQADFTNDEGYLIQAPIEDDDVATYFKWEWTENGNITSRTAIMYIKPVGNLSAGDLSGWNKKVKANGYLEYYYKEMNVSFTFNSPNTILMATQTLPINLAAGTYEIYAQKSDSNLNSGYLASKLYKFLTFKQLATPILSLQNGRLSWGNIPSASSYILSYTGDKEGNLPLNNVNYYELSNDFPDLNTEKNYNFKLMAIGNVPLTKTIYSEDYTYIVAGKTSNQLSVIKPRMAGNLTLSNGGFIWNEEYHTYAYSGVYLEFVFYNSIGVEVTRGTVLASVFDTKYPSFTTLLEDELSECKMYLKAGETYTIKYRELGHELYANSDYKALINNSFTDQFILTPTVSNVYIENDILKWTASGLPSGDFSTIYYDIFFEIGSSHTYATTIASTVALSVNSISINEIKALTTFKENIGSITGIFIIIRGNSEKYITGFNSKVLSVKAITGGTGLILSGGKLAWNTVAGSNCYEIKAEAGSNVILYRIYNSDDKFFLDKLINGNAILIGEELTTITVSGSYWSWDWAEDENIDPSLQYNLYIRYVPQVEGGVYAIPGEFSNVAFSAYKLASPQVQILEGSLSWNAIANAEKYRIHIKYLGEDGNQIGEIAIFETKDTVFNLNIENRLQTSIQVSVQAVGPDESVNGIYYVNNAIIYNHVNYTVNIIDNFVRNGDLISWTCEGNNSYEIVIYDITNNKYYTYTTSNKSYDLSLLNLSYLSNYKVMIKVKGNSGTIGESGTGILSSIILDNDITFNILAQVANIGTKSGYIIWDENQQKTDYKVSINSTYQGNKYVYVLGFENGTYKVKALTKNGSLINFNSEVYVEAGKIYFLPLELEENYSATVYISAVGKEIQETYFASSTQQRLSSNIMRYTSQLTPSYNKSNSTFNWASLAGYYEIILTNVNGEEIFRISELTTNFYQYDKVLLEQGSYTFKVRQYAKDSNSYILKSNYSTIQINIE